MDMQQDYRAIVISKWLESNIATFKQPTEEEIDSQVNYYKRIIKRFMKHLGHDIKILEIGPGYGFFINTLIKEGFSNIEAVDLIPELVDYLAKRYNIKVYNSDIMNFFRMNKLDNTYDVIVAFDVIEHLRKDEILEILDYINKALKPNGLFIMRVPYGGSLAGLYIRYSGFTHETAFTELSVNEIFGVSGFKNITVIPENEFLGKNFKYFFKKFLAKFLSKVLSVNAEFIICSNIICIGFKGNEYKKV